MTWQGGTFRIPPKPGFSPPVVNSILISSSLFLHFFQSTALASSLLRSSVSLSLFTRLPPSFIALSLRFLGYATLLLSISAVLFPFLAISLRFRRFLRFPAAFPMKGGKAKAETAKKADNKLGTKRKASGSVGKRAAKKGKDPNKPKRPPSAFFVFMEEFRKQFQEKNPNNKSVATVGKAAGDKWKSMSESDKAPYVAKAAKRKAEYEKTMAAYNKKQAGGSENEEESDKSKSEVNDDEDESVGEEDEE